MVGVLAARAAGLLWAGRGSLSARAAALRRRDEDGRNGTRWLRTGVVAVCAVAAAASLGAGLAQGVLAANFVVVRQPFQLRSDQLQGNGFAAFVHGRQLDNGQPAGQGQAMARAGFQSARMDGFCGAVHQNVAGLPYTLKLRAGDPITGVPDGSTEISAAGLVLDASALAAVRSQFGSLVLGKSADDVRTGPNPLPGGTPGEFGLEAGVVTIDGLTATAYTTEISGQIQLPGLSLVLERGTTNC